MINATCTVEVVMPVASGKTRKSNAMLGLANVGRG